MIDLSDIGDWSDEDLSLAATTVEREIDRRRVMAEAETVIAEQNMAYLAAAHIEAGQEWRQPTGAHDAYPKDWVVQHGGKVWISLTPANVWEPGVSGWREDVEEGGTPPEWVQPTGAHDAYSIGDRVTFEGQVWESKIDANTWSPTEYPSAWQLIP